MSQQKTQFSAYLLDFIHSLYIHFNSFKLPIHKPPSRGLNKLLQKLEKNDILIATEISRLGRNMLEIMGILQQCLEKECQIWTIKENYKLGSDNIASNFTNTSLILH